MSTLKTNNIQHVDRSDPSIIISTDGGVSIAGTLTYEDVTNVDAVGIVTGRELINAQKQLHVGTGVSIKAGGLNVTAGISTFGANIEIADKIIHNGDDNTAIRFPAADTITAETAGSERLRITSGGLVGVGQATPTHMLHVDSSNASDSTATAFFKGRIIRFDGAASSDSPRLNFSLDGTDKAQILCHRTAIGLDIATLVAEPIKFKINSAEKLRITSSGLVGINLTAPTRPLHIASDEDLTSFTGTTKGAFCISNNDYTSGEYSAIDFTYTGSDNPIGRIATKITGSGSSLHFGTSNNYSNGITNEALVITSTGTVGIATISPAGKLDVHGSGSTAIIRARRLDGNGGYNLFEGYSDVNAASIFYVSNNGLGYFKQRVLIGTTTEGNANADDLTVATSGTTGITVRSGSSNTGNIYFSDATDGSGEFAGAVEYSHSTNSLQLHSNSNEALRINNSRNAKFVGIVTATQFAATTISNGRKNLLINGEMQVNQRVGSPGLSYYNPVTSSIYTLDRWKVMIGSSFDTDSAHIHKSTSSPDGFSSSMKWEIGNTETPSANQNCGIEQKIEGQNLQHLAYGTSSAKTMTLSFYVRSNKLGTYCVHIMQEDGTKYQMHEYTIDSSNTWEKKTIRIVGNTANAINDDNTTGLRIIWVLTVGSGDTVAATSTWASGGDLAGTSNQVNLWDNGSNEWYLTGCQLEVGEIATAYDHRPTGEELLICQRYFEKTYAQGTALGNAANFSGSYTSRDGTASTVQRYYPFNYKVTKRATPDITIYNPQTGATGSCRLDSGSYSATASSQNDSAVMIYSNTGSPPSHYGIFFHLALEAEL